MSASVLAFSPSSNLNVAVYWGQNSYGNQENLAYYCALDSVDVVILSFVTSFPSLALNFANACGTTFSDGLLHCPTIADDIKTCQNNGKLVLLSLGGASGSYGFTSDSEAEDFATVLWNKFGGGSDDERPFDDAVVDGFDFDLENQNAVGTVALGNKLRTIFESDSSKSYYLSAAPQCPYPDASTGELLAGVDIDFAFIQFYNNYCNLGASFNWDTWKDFAENTSPNKDIKLYVGLPGASSSAGSGYQDMSVVEQYITPLMTNDANFGGFSLWDASSGVLNVNSAGVSFIDQLHEYLDEEVSSSTSTKTRTTTVTQSETLIGSSTSTELPNTADDTTTPAVDVAPTTTSTTTPVVDVAPTTTSTAVDAATTSTTETPVATTDSPTTTTAVEVVSPSETEIDPAAPETEIVPETKTLPTTFTTLYVSGTPVVTTIAGKTLTSYVTRTNIVLTKYITVRVNGRPTVIPRI